MRIALVYIPTDGGVGRHVADLASGLRDHGHEVVLVGPAPPEPLRRAGSTAFPHVALCAPRAVRPAADLAALRRTVRVLRAVAPDVVHAHSSKAGALVRLARLAGLRAPVVYTPHGYAFAGAFDSPLERAFYCAVEALLMPLAARTVCVCEAEASLARRIGGGARVRVVHNGVRVAAPAPRETDAPPSLLAIGRLIPGKGLDTLLAALPSVLAVHPATTVRICGEGPARAELERRAEALGIARAVTFVGEQGSLETELARATLLVHPSLAEAFPYAVLDGMAAGLPVVASDVGGIGEAVAHGRTGLLVPAGDAAALARALIALLDDRQRARRMGEEGARIARERFTLERMVAGHLAAYAEVRSDAR